MKIKCDVCGKEEASVFCTSDEAALCDACDRVVHLANKLASKHVRFSLVHPSQNNAPLCDICKERRAWAFCKEDRALFCSECDIPIHNANVHTQNHSRFLLTGIELSPDSISSSISKSSSSSMTFTSSAANSESSSAISKEAYIFQESMLQNPEGSWDPDSRNTWEHQEQGSCFDNTNEYWMENTAAWPFDGFLDASSSRYGS